MESQSGIYRPSWFCRLIFRIDPYDDKLLSGEVPNIPPKNIKGTGTEADRVLEVRPDPLAPAGLTRLVLWPKGATAAPGGPNAQVKSGDGLTHHLDIAPTSFNLEYNGIRTADTFKCKFRFVDLPIDPRMIRSCGVQFYLGTLSEEQYAAVMRGEITRAEQSRNAVLPYEWVDKLGRKRSNLRFEGFVDKWSNTWDDEEPTIEIECRDLTSFFLKEECPPQLGVSTELQIDVAIANYLACFPRMAGMAVEYRGGNPANVLLKDSLQLTAYSTTNGAPPSAQGGGGGSKLKVWDYLADMVGCIGHTIRVEGTTVIIQRARTIKSSNVNGQQRPDDPFKSRLTPNRAMIWARNIKKMNISRSFEGGDPINIEVRAYSPADKRTFIGRFPEKSSTNATTKETSLGRLVDSNSGDGSKQEKWRVFVVQGVKGEDTLRAIAQNIYEMISRQEIQAQIETMDLASFGGGNEDPDLLDVKAGDAINLLVDYKNPINDLSGYEKSLIVLSQAEQFLVNLGFPREFAKEYAKAYSKAGFMTDLIIRKMSIDGDSGSADSDPSGVSLKIEAANYIEIRADRDIKDPKFE